MEWKPVNSRDLAVYNGNPIDIQKHSTSFSFSHSGFEDDLGSCSSSNYPKVGGSWWSGDLRMGLRLERPKSSVSSLGVSQAPMKKSRASFHDIQNPCCQVEGCNLDLRTAKDYHRRHRICEQHSKSPRVIVAGMERRFCQQCSRFHELSEFDAKKRSCRRRLFDHNARRRRVPSESIQLPSTRASSAFYDIVGIQSNALLNRFRASPSGPLSGTLRFSSDPIQNPAPNLQMVDQCGLHVSMANYTRARDLFKAPSLLSTNSWSLNHDESTTTSNMEGFFYENTGFPMHRTTPVDPESHHVGLINSSLGRW